MDSFPADDPSSLRCELRVIRAKNIESKCMGCLFVRCYISAGKNKRIRLESKEISSESNLVWNQSFSLDCFGNKQSISMLMQGTVVFELRWRNIVPVFGRIGRKSQLLGRAEIPWKSVFESSTMKIERWVVMTSKSGKYRQQDVKPPAVEISMKVVVPVMELELPKQRKISIGKLRKWDECGCVDCGCRSCADYEMFALAAAMD